MLKKTPKRFKKRRKSIWKSWKSLDKKTTIDLSDSEYLKLKFEYSKLEFEYSYFNFGYSYLGEGSEGC